MRSMEEFDADVIVIGLGAWGSSTLWRLAERGVRCIGIERYGINHAFGSSHGYSRLFRIACQEHPDLVPLARRSRDLWRELEDRSGEALLFETGLLTVGKPGSDMVSGAVAAGKKFGVPLEQLSAEEVRTKYPAYATVADDEIGIWDAAAGTLKPDAAVRAASEAAMAAGAEAYFDTRVTGVDLVDGGVIVSTAGRTFTARKAIITAGPWLGKLVPDLPLTPLRTPMQWFESKLGESDPAFDLEQFPAFMRRVEDGVSLWGHGRAFGEPVKMGLGIDIGAFDPTDPDDCDRGINPARDWTALSRNIEQLFPGLDPIPSTSRPCMIAVTPDDQFLIGRPANDPRLLIGGGCSGHGFKHAAGIGELLAQMSQGEALFMNADFVDPNRFESVSQLRKAS